MKKIFIFGCWLINCAFGSVHNGTRFLLSQSCSSPKCLVPSGQTWVVDSSVDLETITIQGTLIWDVNKPNIEVRTFGILVEEGGTFQLGTPSQPMIQPATIYIKNPRNGAVGNHPYVGQRYMAGFGKATIQIHGRPLQRTWTVLSRNHEAGEADLDLKDDPNWMGWRVGDRVGVATTTRGESTIHHITSIAGTSIKIDPPLSAEHWGGWREIEGLRFEMAAEVVNMERNIVITGDHDDFHATGLGWHGGVFMKRFSNIGTDAMVHGDVGVWDVRYARMEFCGQLDVLGRYCSHLHLVQDCPECIIQGNAFVESYQSAVTIHGTHSSLVDSNVMWDNRGVAIYTEDGNEINNVISNNAIVCHDIYYCRIQWQMMAGPAQKEGGIFMFGMANDVIGNHVIGHEHGMWTPGGAQPNGRPLGFSLGQVCPQYIPFGKIQRNIFHDCQRFGTYLDFQYPRKVHFNWNGMQADYPGDPKLGCDEFTEDGHDNGDAANLIEDQFDWHNTYVGGYFMGDISWVRYTSVNNAHGLYWKWSKNFADGVSYHIRDSVIANDRNDHVDGQLQMLLPGGPHVFRMKNVTFAGGPIGVGVIAAPQHCGLADHNNNVPGSMCNVQYLLEDLDFSRVNPRQGESVELLHFGASGGNPLSPMYIAGDDSLDGHHVVVSNFMDGFAKVQGCMGPVAKYGGGYACDTSVQVRRINIWAPDMGDLTLKGPGYDTNPNWDAAIMGSNAGILHFDNIPMNAVRQLDHGYGAHVVIGQSYTLEGLHWAGDIVVEVSDPILPDYFGKPRDQEGITLTLILQDGRSTVCHPNAGESRLWHSPDGITISDKYHIDFDSLGNCGTAFRTLTAPPTRPPIPTIPPSGDCGCPGAEYDGRCVNNDPFGGVGCGACGIPHCRYCGGGDPYPDCSYGSTTGRPSNGPSKWTTYTTPTLSPGGCDCVGAMFDPRCSDTNDPYGGLGCMACGFDDCRFCGNEGLPDCNNDPPPTIPPPSGCDCDGAMKDTRCRDPGSDPYGGLGCMACGLNECRFCGRDGFPECGDGPHPEPTTKPPQPGGCDCDRAMHDTRCSDPSNDPFGGLGCMACGLEDCRFCGFHPYPDCQ